MIDTVNAASQSSAQEARHSRFIWAFENLFLGNRATMAKSLGVGWRTVSDVVGGRRRASPRLLQLLANTGEVSKDWLFMGAGSPQPEKAAGTVPQALIASLAVRILQVRRILDGIVDDLQQLSDAGGVPRSSSPTELHIRSSYPPEELVL